MEEELCLEGERREAQEEDTLAEVSDCEDNYVEDEAINRSWEGYLTGSMAALSIGGNMAASNGALAGAYADRYDSFDTLA